jgi:hypothetical protein
MAPRTRRRTIRLLALLSFVVLLVPAAAAVARRAPTSFESRFRREVGTPAPERSAPALVTEAELVRLPPAVRAYVRYTGAVGRPRVTSFRARFRGRLRAKPDGAFMPFEAEQENRFAPSSRLFLLRSRLFGIPFVALHRYVGSTATMEVSVAELIPIVDARGPEMNRSETVTLLNDICVFAPSNFVDPAVVFEELAPLTVKATFENAGQRVSAVLHFDDEGKLVNFHSDDRYQSADGKTYRLYRWSTPLSNYRDFGGVRVASHGEASWRMPDGELVYGIFDLVELRYNESGARR